MVYSLEFGVRHNGSAHEGKFSQLSQVQRGRYTDKIKELTYAGQLYVREKNGACQGRFRLRRAGPMEIKERLDRGLSVELITQCQASPPATPSSHSVTIYYSSSSIAEWDRLDLAKLGTGVLGVAILPDSGEAVLASVSFEVEWRRHASRQWDAFV